ncbi:MAG: gliding motility-associated C-terminal domain-containing protein, partial [Saprospiraceae bacterium]
ETRRVLFHSIIFEITSFALSDTNYVFLTSCNPADTGTIVNSFTNQNNCDSVVFEITNFALSDTNYVFLTSCNPADTGTVVNNFTNQNNCDSLIFEITSLLASDTSYFFFSSCNPADTGTVVNNFTNQNNCDSIVFEITSLLASDTSYFFFSSCNPTDTGTVITNFTNQNNCDSTVFEITSLLLGDTTTIFTRSCNPLDTGQFWQTYPLVGACDSVVHQIVSLNLIDTLFFELTSCNPADTGTVINTLITAAGCDSILVFSTTLIPTVVSNIISGYTCDPSAVSSDTLFLQSALGCDSLVVTSTLLETLELFTRNFSISCAGEADGVIFVDSVQGGMGPYLYSISSGPYQQSFIFTELSSAVYDISVQDIDGCEGTATVILEEPAPILIDLAVELEIDFGDSIQLNPMINQAIDSFHWSAFDPLLCTDCLNPVVQPSITTTYTLTVITPDGCTAEQRVTVRVKKDRLVFIPTAFSPNLDGANDYFTIYGGKGVKNIRTFQVFDRWGSLVYEANNFPPNQENLGWDGQLKGRPMNPAVFVYFAEIEFTDGEIILYEGDFSLIR